MVRFAYFTTARLTEGFREMFFVKRLLSAIVNYEMEPMLKGREEKENEYSE